MHLICVDFLFCSGTGSQNLDTAIETHGGCINKFCYVEVDQSVGNIPTCGVVARILCILVGFTGESSWLAVYLDIAPAYLVCAAIIATPSCCISLFLDKRVPPVFGTAQLSIACQSHLEAFCAAGDHRGPSVWPVNCLHRDHVVLIFDDYLK